MMQIDLYYDLVCPWCYIGVHRLRRAMADRQAETIPVAWRAFQLNPGMPTGGMERRAYLAARFGGLNRAQHIHRLIAETAAKDGLPLNLDRITRTPCTVAAHCLVLLAERSGRSVWPVIDALFHKYFVEGQDLGDLSVLARVAGAQGMDPATTHRLLAHGAYAEVVLRADMEARQAGIQAVPCFLFGGQYSLAGAQEPKALGPMIDIIKIQAALEPLTVGAE